MLGGRVGDIIGRKRGASGRIDRIRCRVCARRRGAHRPVALRRRALQGAFAALLAPAALSLISVAFTDPRERAKAFGVYGAIQGACGAVAVAVAAIPSVHDSLARGEWHYDIPGAVLVTSGVAGLVSACTKAAEPGSGWTSIPTVSFPGAAVVLLIAFVAVENRVAHPLLPLRIVRDRNSGGALITMVLIAGGMFGMLLIVTYYLQINLGYSPLSSGLAFLPFSIGIIVSAFLASTLMPRTCAETAHDRRHGDWHRRTAVVRHPRHVIHVQLDGHAIADPGQPRTRSGVRPAGQFRARRCRTLRCRGRQAILNATNQLGAAVVTALINTVYAAAVNSLHSAPITGSPLASMPSVYGYRPSLIVAGALLAAGAIVVSTVVRSTNKDAPPM